jgi:Tripartite tricarboxylate transporter TctB family
VPKGRSKLRIKSPQDVGAAIVFMAIGAAGLYFGSDLTLGTAARMGPGYFPVMLSAIIFGIGVIVGCKGLTIEGPPLEPFRPRPILIIVAGILAFGFLIEKLGLAITAAFVTVLAGFARRDVNLMETFVLAACLALFCVGLFVYALSQPFPAWWGR